jgi:hypothetical protein
VPRSAVGALKTEVGGNGHSGGLIDVYGTLVCVGVVRKCECTGADCASFGCAEMPRCLGQRLIQGSAHQ